MTRFCQHYILAAAVLLLSAAAALAAEPDKMTRADALMQSPSLGYQQARQALTLYEEQLRAGGPGAALLPRLARTAFVMGDMAPKHQRAAHYDQGLAYAERLLKEQPGAVAGHYWKALNLCGLADAGGRLQGFKLLPRIVAELQHSLALNEAFDQAGAHRVLGRIYFEAPAWPLSVGDRKKSLQHLTAAVRLAPDNSTNHLYLAETLLAMGSRTQALEELAKVMQAQHYAIKPQDLVADRREARRLMAEIKGEE